MQNANNINSNLKTLYGNTNILCRSTGKPTMVFKEIQKLKRLL
jgi:hypothetical protein